MLLLHRKIGESIRIADDIYLTVTSNDGENVTLGFDAPEHVEILREEIYRRLKSKQQFGDEYSGKIKSEVFKSALMGGMQMKAK